MDIPKSTTTNGECEEEKTTIFETTTNSITEPPTGTIIICQKDNNFESIPMEENDTTIINDESNINTKTDLELTENHNFHQTLNNIEVDTISHDDGQNGIIEKNTSIDQPGINDNNCSSPPPSIIDDTNNASKMVKQNTIPPNIPTPSTNNNNNNTSSSHTNKRKSDYQIESNIDEKKVHNMRRNIRGVINETNFDTITINAQREESERLARVQGLKKLVKQKYLHSALESMVEGVHEVQDDDFLAACEPIEAPSQSLLKKTTFDLKDKLQRLEEKKSDKIHWNQWLSAEPKDPPCSQKKEEVVTIDSSSEDDDCIILSDSDEDCLDDEADDHHNSGLHVRDVLNIPNEHGKVMVNVGHVDSEPDIFLAPQIAKIIKPHQIGGVRFLFDNIIESTKRFNTSSGFGCILAHSMGLGKTLQVVSFSDIFLRHTDSKTILCVMPINTIQNWVKEYNLWIPEESPCHEKVRPRNFKVFALNDQHKTMSSRSKVIARWYAEGGVLLIGYELFRVLGLKIIKRRGEGKKSQESNEHKKLLDNMHAALVKPGPDLVICDEGHRIKNAHAGISIALKQIRTRRRIVLTGYPLQNNLLEYWCMVDFVRPNYLGSKTEFCNMFERPIQNGQCIDSTPEDIKLMRYRAHVLHSLLVGFVQRRSDSVLQNSLPQKLEYVILTKMTKFQRQLYDAFMNEVVRKKKVPNPLKAFAVCCKIWNHPDVLYNFVKKRESDLDLDIDEQETAVKAKPKAEVKSANEFGPLTVFGNEAFPSSATGINFQNTNNLWPDGGDGNPVDAQQHPKLVGMLKTQPPLSNTAKCSSEIVDLDTKEVQFVKSDLTADLEVGGNGSFEQNNGPTGSTSNPSSSNTSTVAKPIVKMETRAGNDTISYDWAIALIKDYEPGIVSTSPKMQIFIHILEESIKLGDRVLVFSQSLLTLNLMETFLQGLIIPESDKHWKKNVSYFRLDGSTSSLDREKLVNEFNSNIEVKLFLISTRAGSLGINLTGANRVVVFDASWNPCHDTQAVHRIYRYGQGKPCFVYRIVMDNCLEKNIYDRQVKKQGMSDRVVDECNPDAHLSIKELTNLCYDKAEEEEKNTEFKQPIENYTDDVMRSMLTTHKSILSKEPFYHESLLIDRKEKKLSQTEKKLAKRGYEIEKKASTKPHHFIHNIHNVHNMVQNRDCMINKVNTQHMFKHRIAQPFNKNSNIKMTRWIPAEVWQRQGMSSQEMKLPIDVAIPTNSNDSSNIVVKAGEKVMVLNSPKGVYMQLESGKIIAIKTSAEAAKDKILQAKKIASAQLMEKKNLKEVTLRAAPAATAAPTNDQASDDSENDDCIVINDGINESSESSFDLSYTSPKNRSEITPVKQQPQQQQHQQKQHTTPSQTFPKTLPAVPPEAQKDKPITTNQAQQQPPPQPQSQSQPPTATNATTTANHQYQRDKEDPIAQQNMFVQEKPIQLMQNHQIPQEKLDPALAKPTYGHHHTTDLPPQSHQYSQENPELLAQHHSMRMDKSAEPHIPNHHSYDIKPKLESAPAANNYIHKQSNFMYGSSANHSGYDMLPAQHNMENQHYQAMAAPQRWENKSPDMYKQPFKISNIPAPYPSTAVCDLSLFEKNDKPQHPINESVNADPYNSRPSYPPVCKPTEEPPYQHSLNYNLNYQNNNPHASMMQPPPSLPPTEDNGSSLNALYHYNTKTENPYSEHLYDNSDASSASSHTNYHQQMSKYSYGYYQPPPYLPNYASPSSSSSSSSNNSNKPYDNNTFPSVSNPYAYMRRPAAYSTNSMNGVDVGYNYAEHQGWMKKHLPE